MAKKSNSKKKWSIRRLAPAGLWVSGIAVLAAGILLVIKLLIFIGLFSAPNQKPFNIALWIALGVAIIGPALYALLDPKRVRDFLTGRQARHGSNAIIMLIAFILILVVVNAIVYQNPTQWDWTESKQNSLAPETISTLKALPGPVHAIGFFTSAVSKSDTESFLKNVKTKSNGKFTYEFVDPNSNPAKAQQYKVTQDGTVVLILSGHQELITTSSEQNFTNALIRLMNPGQRTVYFLTGHGERNSETAGAKAYTRARTVLESKNYTVKTLNLLAQNNIPEDALAVIVNGPTQPISSTEISLLKDYVSKGGSLVILEDPILTPDAGNAPDPMLDYLKATWSITVNNDIVIDPSSSQVIVAIENTYGSHAITDSLISQNLVAFFPTARSITISTAVQGVQTTALVKTIDRSWGETDFNALQNNQVSFDAKTDIPGPLTIAVAAESTSVKGRIVVIGDSDFASDTYFDQYGNSDLFINSVDWAAGQENMISLTTKQPIARQMRLINNMTMLLLAFAFVILIPGLIVAGGVVSWLVRRSRG